MVLKVFNSFSKKMEEFVPIEEGKVKMYTCGPTVYNHAHIGNFRAYTWEDILKRYLIFSGYEVKQVMNLTDIDDKTIKGSMREKVPLNEYTKKYKESFFEDCKKMNILPAEIYTPATEYVQEMVKIVEKLLEKGLAYKANDGCIYYSIKKFPEYGKLAGIDTDKLKDGARIKQDEYEKEGIGDFALWKAWDENDGDVYWETSLGKGRPGWHIECSAMAMKELGETIDIHTGGVDNKFPHHENEIAQSEGATGKKFVKYWLHCEHLLVDGKKMSKSLGNFYTIKDLLGKGLDAIAIRYTLINSNYRQQLNFTIDSVKKSEKTLEGLNGFVERLRNLKEKEDEEDVEEIIKEFEKSFVEAMDNDLNVPEATKHLFEFVKKINKLIDEEKIDSKNAEKVLAFLKKIDSVLGVINWEEEKIELTKEQEKMIKEREEARKEKNWKKSDEIRALLEKQGLKIFDNKDGTTTVKKK